MLLCVVGVVSVVGVVGVVGDDGLLEKRGTGNQISAAKPCRVHPCRAFF